VEVRKKQKAKPVFSEDLEIARHHEIDESNLPVHFKEE
jgi:hypothetical protein